MYSNNINRIYRWVCVALISAVCVVGRFLFTAISNVQPMTVIYLLLAWYVSLKDAIITIIISMVVTNMYFGMGPWTFFQIGVFSLIMMIAKIGRIVIDWQTQSKRAIKVYEVIMSAMAGILYGLIYSILWVNMAQMTNFWAYYVRGISYDIAHAVGNSVFYIILSPIMIPLLKKFQKKFNNQVTKSFPF